MSTNGTVVHARNFVKRQASDTTASFVSSLTLVLIPSQAPTVNSSASTIWFSITADSGDIQYTPQGNTTFNTTNPGEYDQGQNISLLVINPSTSFTSNDTFPYRTIYKPSNLPPVLGSTPKAETRDFDINAERWSDESHLKILNTRKKIDRPRAAAHCDAPTLNQSLILGGVRGSRYLSDPGYANYAQYDAYKCMSVFGRVQAQKTPARDHLEEGNCRRIKKPRIIHFPCGDRTLRLTSRRVQLSYY
ncbi:hypothetical protein LZ554_008107 [Drepanopeziza brunnea f. sp. 'monogermtubi']|nr:hypothetical protein LZ554_008107 [Drepanopeziza brunnea f. sp. 'monogermtubi']